ncbi:MAG TPA: M14 family metallopeptidase [Candidatus Bathyarchaeia archaeon]|nr:M14 family metallopeptidase [Candidatus Bathyarchaeia archaeon]
MDKRFQFPSAVLFILVIIIVAGSFIPSAQGGIYDPFHTKEEKIAMWKTLWDAHPNTEYLSAGKTYGGADIWLFTAGNPGGGRVLWDAEMHGNEDKGSEILFLMAQWLLESEDLRAKRILEENYVMFIPVVNSNNTRGNGDTEKSPYGVDLNRNFQTGWYRSSPVDDTYGGPSALSEPETRAIREVFSSYKPMFYVNLHCGGGPYTAYYDLGNWTLIKQVTSRTNEIAEEMGIVPYRTIHLGSSGFAMGDAVALGVQSSWLIETVGLSSAWEHSQADYDDLRNVYLPKCLAILIAMCNISALSSLPTTDVPRIQSIVQSPPQGEVYLNDAVQVNVTLVNSTVATRKVSLNYALGTGEWFAVNMAEVVEGIWSGEIPASPSGGNVTYSVTAENMEGKTTTSAPISYTYSDEPGLSTLVLFTLASLSLSVIILLEKRWT